MERYQYDLSHFSFVPFDIGRLQTLTVIPVVGGDSFALNYRAVARLSPLRRGLTLDAQVDLFAFYIPYRHIYGDDWIDFIKDGVDESITLTSGPAVGDHRYLGARIELASGNYPLWLVGGYNQIWNRYFRAPTDSASERTLTQLETGGSRAALYGVLCGRLKTPWSTGIEGEPVAADKEVTVTAGQLDIIDLEQAQQRYRTEEERAFFATRYTDVLEQQYGGFANPDADQRPTLLMRQKNTLSGYDVDGTADANLGQFSGKSAATVGLNLPPRYMPEHGTIWIMGLTRFPTVNVRETHYLFSRPNPDYIDITGEPDLVQAQPPMTALGS